MTRLSVELFIEDLTALSGLTAGVNGIIDGSMRLVKATQNGSGWYRYHSPSSLPIISPIIVSGENGRWVRNGDRILTGTSAPTTAPPITGLFYFESTNDKLYHSIGTSSVADWHQISGSSYSLPTPQTATITATALNNNSRLDTNITIQIAPFIITRIQSNVGARVSLYFTPGHQSTNAPLPFGIDGFDDLYQIGTILDVQFAAAFDFPCAILAHGRRGNSADIPISITNKSGTNQDCTITITYEAIS